MISDGAAFPALPGSVGDARRFVASWLTEAGCPRPSIDAASLLVSELATNAVVHAATPYLVAMMLEGGLLTVELSDGDARKPALREPDSEGGRGLQIVDAVAQEWGVRTKRDGKAVYFRLQC